MTSAQRDLLHEAIVIEQRLYRPLMKRSDCVGFAATGLVSKLRYDPAYDVYQRAWHVAHRWRESLEWLLTDGELSTHSAQELGLYP